MSALAVLTVYTAGYIDTAGLLKSRLSPVDAARKKVEKALHIKRDNYTPQFDVIRKEEYSDKAAEYGIFKPFMNAVTPAILFRPETAPGKFPAVIVLHGHGAGIADSALDPKSAEKAVASKLASEGYVTFTFNFSEIEKSLGYESHDAAIKGGLLNGKPVMGYLIAAAEKAVDLLSDKDYVDSGSIGICGTSFGGHVAVYAAFLDKRIKSVVDAAFFTSYQRMIREKYCVCQIVPGILAFTDFPVIASNIAPRPALYLIGKRDESTPWQPAREMFDRIVVRKYAGKNAEKNVKMIVHDGGHEILVEHVIKWFRDTLK